MEARDLLCGVNLDVDRLSTIRKGINDSIRRARRSINNFRKESGHGRKHLPEGSGKYTVGCVDVMSDHKVKGIFFRLYYPTNRTNIHVKASTWPLWLPKKQYGQGYAYFRRMNTKVVGKILNLVAGEVYVPVLWQAPVIEGQGSFPVIIFTHGLGGNRTTYSTLCTDLASHGFIVVAIEHRDGSASFTYCFEAPTEEGEEAGEAGCPGENLSDSQSLQEHLTQVKEQWLWYERQEREDDFNVRNNQICLRVEEIEQLLDVLRSLTAGDGARNVLSPTFDLTQFRGKLDLDSISVVGHSFGASTCIAALAHNQNFKCGVALDAWMKPLDECVYEGVTQPLLFVNTETFHWRENLQEMMRLCDQCDEDMALHRALITIRGTCHQSHSDFQFILPGKLGRYLEMRNTLKPKLAMSINNKAVIGFLSKHLDLPQDDSLDDILRGEHEHVILGTNVDISQQQ